MERIKLNKIFVMAVSFILLMSVVLLFSACGEKYEIEYGDYKIVAYQAIQVDTNESSFFEPDDTLPVPVKYKENLTLNKNGTVENSIIYNSYEIDSKGNIQFYTKKNEDGITGYFKDGVMYLFYGQFKGSKDKTIKYDMYAVYTLNGVPLETTTE